MEKNQPKQVLQEPDSLPEAFHWDASMKAGACPEAEPQKFLFLIRYSQNIGFECSIPVQGCLHSTQETRF